ncbi:MAG: type II toxin-antitoxin system HicA family toxin [Bauldia sp.]
MARLRREGWELMRHGGEHDVYRKAGRLGTISLPRHREISRGVARTIAKAADWQ